MPRLWRAFRRLSHNCDPFCVDTADQGPKNASRAIVTCYIRLVLISHYILCHEHTDIVFPKTKGMAFSSGKELGAAITQGMSALSMEFFVFPKWKALPYCGKARLIAFRSSVFLQVAFVPPKPLTAMNYDMLAVDQVNNTLRLTGAGTRWSIFCIMVVTTAKRVLGAMLPTPQSNLTTGVPKNCGLLLIQVPLRGLQGLTPSALPPSSGPTPLARRSTTCSSVDNCLKAVVVSEMRSGGSDSYGNVCKSSMASPLMAVLSRNGTSSFPGLGKD